MFRSHDLKIHFSLFELLNQSVLVLSVGPEVVFDNDLITFVGYQTFIDLFSPSLHQLLHALLLVWVLFVNVKLP